MRAGSLARALLATGVALGVLPVVAAHPAYACSCAPAAEQQRYEQASHVFKGTVIAAQGAAAPDGQASPEPVIYTFDVISTYKGRVTDPQKVSTPAGSAACGVNLEGDGPYLVFASRRTEPGTQAAAPELTMDLCGGTRPIGANDEPTFGRPAAQPEAPAPAPPSAAEPATEPDTEPDTEPEKQPGLTSRLIQNLGGIIGQLGGLAGQTPPPGG